MMVRDTVRVGIVGSVRMSVHSRSMPVGRYLVPRVEDPRVRRAADVTGDAVGVNLVALALHVFSASGVGWEKTTASSAAVVYRIVTFHQPAAGGFLSMRRLDVHGRI